MIAEDIPGARGRPACPSCFNEPRPARRSSSPPPAIPRPTLVGLGRTTSLPFRVNRALLRGRPKKGTQAKRLVRAERNARAQAPYLVVVECFSALLRKERERAITPTHRRRASSQVTADVAARRLGLVPVTADLLERAHASPRCVSSRGVASLSRRHPSRLGERCQSWPLCSNDARVRAAAAGSDYSLSPLPA